MGSEPGTLRAWHRPHMEIILRYPSSSQTAKNKLRSILLARERHPRTKVRSRRYPTERAAPSLATFSFYRPPGSRLHTTLQGSHAHPRGHPSKCAPTSAHSLQPCHIAAQDLGGHTHYAVCQGPREETRAGRMRAGYHVCKRFQDPLECGPEVGGGASSREHSPLA